MWRIPNATISASCMTSELETIAILQACRTLCVVGHAAIIFCFALAMIDFCFKFHVYHFHNAYNYILLTWRTLCAVGLTNYTLHVETMSTLQAWRTLCVVGPYGREGERKKTFLRCVMFFIGEGRAAHTRFPCALVSISVCGLIAGSSGLVICFLHALRPLLGDGKTADRPNNSNNKST